MVVILGGKPQENSNEDELHDLNQFLEEEEDGIEDEEGIFSEEEEGKEDEDDAVNKLMRISWSNQGKYEVVQSPEAGRNLDSTENVYFEITDLRKSWQVKQDVIQENQDDDVKTSETPLEKSSEKISLDRTQEPGFYDVIALDSTYSKLALDALHLGDQMKLDRITPCNQCPIHPAMFSKLYRQSKSLSEFFKKREKSELIQAAMHFLMDHPDSSIWAQVLHVILIFIIMISTAQIILSSVDKYENWIGWIYIEETVSSLFTIELLLRFLGSKNKLNFWKRAMNWVDLISIVPFYVSLFISYDDRGSDNIKILRIIRLIRVVRLLKLGRYVEVLSVFTKALVDSGEPLALFILFVLLLSLLSGTIMTAIEGGGNSKFNGIPMGIYWALTTLTTTGFGDLTPSEDWGKVLANITMIIGILIFSLPLAVIGANFQTAFSEFKNQKSRKKQKKKLRNVELKKIIHLIVKDHNDLALNLAQLLSILEKESNLNIDQNKRPYSIRFLKKKQQIIDNTFQSVSSHFESNLKKLRESVWGVLENVQKVTELICLVSQEWKDEDENQIKVQNEDKLLSAKSQLRKISDSIANLLHGQK